MKIKLIADVPVAPEHGLVKGAVFEVLDTYREGRGRNGWVVKSRNACEEVFVHNREAKEIKGQ